MSENTVSRPRIDRKMVDKDGNITPFWYQLISNLIVRVGGVTAEIIDAASIREQLEAFEVAPLDQPAPEAQDDPAPPATTYVTEDAAPDGRLQALEAEVAELRNQLNGLLQGIQP